MAGRLLSHFCKPRNEGIVHCPHSGGEEARAATQMAREMERISPEEEEEPKKQPLEATKCALAAKPFCFVFLMGFGGQCQQLIFFFPPSFCIQISRSAIVIEA